MNGPNPADKHPLQGFPQVCFIKNSITRPNIVVGDYTYYDDPQDAQGFELNVLYHYPFIGDRLIIGKFCALAHGVKFIMNGANHRMNGISSYPFHIFGNGWEKAMPRPGDLPYKGDTVVGNDVWIGYDATIMPGTSIGNGAIIAAKSVVVGNVPAYTIYGGNPARLIRARFDPANVALLQEIAWWDWPIERISQHLDLIVAGDVQALVAANYPP